jgi:hypothetical protein
MVHSLEIFPVKAPEQGQRSWLELKAISNQSSSSIWNLRNPITAASELASWIRGGDSERMGETQKISLSKLAATVM